LEKYLNENVKNIQISGIRKFFNMVSGIEGMISLTIGQPDFPTPDHIKKAGMNAIHENFTVYTHNAGYLPLRQAISHYVHKKYDLTYSPESEIIVTIGASEAIDVALRPFYVREMKSSFQVRSIPAMNRSFGCAKGSLFLPILGTTNLN